LELEKKGGQICREKVIGDLVGFWQFLAVYGGPILLYIKFWIDIVGMHVLTLSNFSVGSTVWEILPSKKKFPSSLDNGPAPLTT